MGLFFQESTKHGFIFPKTDSIASLCFQAACFEQCVNYTVIFREVDLSTGHFHAAQVTKHQLTLKIFLNNIETFVWYICNMQVIMTVFVNIPSNDYPNEKYLGT